MTRVRRDISATASPLPRGRPARWHARCYLQRCNGADSGVVILRLQKEYAMRARKLECLTFALAMALATAAGAQTSSSTQSNGARSATSGGMHNGMTAQCANLTGRAMSDCVRDHYPSCASMTGTALNDCMRNNNATGARRGSSAMRDKSGGGTASGTPGTGTTGTTGSAGTGNSGTGGASGASGTGGASGAGTGK
ncbi:MAG TPA: hypothetical protein VJV77_13545 [Casimicrobiaceae bacterium]|nr:hypothetical protein [Casimicrobiaceae bacterium]